MKRIFFVIFTVMLMSCNKDSEQDWTGMEYFDFEISGKVTDNAGKPVCGISVSAYGSETKTDTDGRYVIKGSGGTSTSVFVNFTDVDGAENGGIYTSAMTTVELDYIKGRHGPYLGLFGKSGVDVTLIIGLTPSVGPDILL